jgi:hypothetical protein
VAAGGAIREMTLAQRVDRGDLWEKRARRIGQKTLQDNVLALSPQLKGRF